MRFDEVINELAATRGVMACAVVDYDSGMILDGQSPSGMSLDILSVGNTEIVRSEIQAIERLFGADAAVQDEIEDILITLGKYYFLLRPMKSSPGLFLFLVLDKEKANLALSRRALKDADRRYKGKDD